MDQWIYFVEKIALPNEKNQVRISETNKELNNLGRDGWELVNVIQTQPGEWVGFYKRKILI